MANKRITDQTTDTALSSGDYVIVDSSTEGTRKFDLGSELSDIKEDLDSMTGMSEDFKQALHDILEKVAYIDSDGQEYLDALDEAMWPPAPPATLESITAVYTQSGTVYDSDSLNSLKSDLVVTAHYSDSTSETVPSSNYSLSGTLEVGTSTIAISYIGKSTTFTVTVSSPAYALQNGSITFNDGVKVTITNGKHIFIETTNTIGTESSSDGLVNLSDISVNTSALHSNGATAVNNRSTLFTLPANSNVVMSTKNVIVDEDAFYSSSQSVEGEIALNLRKASSTQSALTAISVKQSSGEQSGTNSINSATNIGCAFMYLNRINANKSIEFDLEVTVNGVRWI